MVEIDRLCANAKCSNVGKHLCSGCGEEIYCSKDCQKAHWPSHKQSCKTAVKPESAAVLKSFDSLSIKQLKNLVKAKAAAMESKKKNIVLSQLEKIVEKPSLVKFVKDHVQLSEVEALLSAPVKAESATPSSSVRSSGAKKTSKKSGNNHMPSPTPEQLRQQASLMRRNPGMVRKAQPAFAKMTDEQIRQYADQLEQAAADPNMMKEVERMSKLSDSEREELQSLQEGLSGTKEMDAAWMDRTIQALKTKPGLFKNMMRGKGAMLGGVTDEQIDSFIDMASRMDAGTLKMICYTLKFIGGLYQPLVQLYKTIDSYTFGSARYIALAVVVLLLYMLSMVTFAFLRWLWVLLLRLYAYLAPGAAGASVSSASSSAAGGIKTAVDLGLDAGAAVGAAAGVKAAAEGVKEAMTGVQEPVQMEQQPLGGLESEDAEFDF